MSEREIIDKIEQSRKLLFEIREESQIPSIVHAAHQADVYCHGMLWELGGEDATTPELSEGIDQ